jgi:hypothetical protein
MRLRALIAFLCRAREAFYVGGNSRGAESGLFGRTFEKLVEEKQEESGFFFARYAISVYSSLASCIENGKDENFEI